MCDCLRINEELAERTGHTIELPIIGPQRPPIYATYYTKRGNPKRGAAVFPSYCPWCGEKYEPTEAEQSLTEKAA